MTEDVEWYIARDGKQHGPISSVEMKKFVELGHLRPTDLVWQAAFTDWRNGHEVFPDTARAHPQQADPPPEQNQRPAPAPVQNARSPNDFGSGQPNDGSRHRPNPDQMAHPSVAPGGLRERLQDVAQQDPGHRQQRHAPHGSYPAGAPSPAGAGSGRGQAWTGQQPALGGQAPHGQHSILQEPNQLMPHPAATRPQGRPEHPQGRMAAGPAKTPRRGGADEPPPRRGRILVWSLAAVLAIAALAALAWFGFQHLGSSGNIFASSEAFRASPFLTRGSTIDEIDADLQSRALWKILKTDHPEWYAKTLTDIKGWRGAKKTEQAIAGDVAKSIVELRRVHSKSALAASSASFITIARAFAANLKALGAADSKVCYDFISFGEGGPAVLSLLTNPNISEPLHRQLAAIFLAVRDGRQSPKAYGTAIKEDYDALGKRLTEKHGWTPVDLQVFSNPQLLSKAPPEKVCAMVQDWFTAQVNLEDEALRSRLLFESLRPLVAG
ncbi:MAG: hypothetical protein RLZ98_2178 [Pseudomonadota bacterium]|jgi:hypothetical protein